LKPSFFPNKNFEAVMFELYFVPNSLPVICMLLVFDCSQQGHVAVKLCTDKILQFLAGGAG